MIQTLPVLYVSTNRIGTENYLRWVFLILLCTITHTTSMGQTFQVAGGIPYFPAYTNTAAVTLSPIPPGAVIYDKSQAQLQLYTGSAWVSLCSANVPSASNASTAFRIVKGIPVLSVTSLSTTATAGATYLKTTGGIYVGDGSAWNALGTYMNKTNVTTTNPARMGAVAGTGSALVIPVLSTAPTATAAGAAYFDAVTANLKVYSGTAWLTVGCNLPYAINVTGASGSIYSGSSFTGNYVYKQDDPLPQGSSIYRWYSADNSSGSGKTLIGTSISYSIPSTIAGKYIAFGVIPVTNTGLTGTEVLSTWNLVQWKCGDVLTKTHNAGSVAPVSKTVNYGTLVTSLSGSSKCWITQNLGADRQASSAYDNSAAAAGWYWQFGLKQGYDGYGNGSTWTTNVNTAPNTNWTSANDPCTILLGSGWRIPTQGEYINVTSGYSYATGMYSSVLKIHAAGYLTAPTTFKWHSGNGDDQGVYWSSTRESSGWGRRLFCDHTWNNASSSNPSTNGCTLRCIKD